MQFEGGYRYPGGAVCLVLLLIGGLAVVAVWMIAKLPVYRVTALLLNVEGTFLWASSFTPKGLLPPPRGFLALLRWFFNQEGGVPFAFNQAMFYAGILLVVAGTILGSIAG